MLSPRLLLPACFAASIGVSVARGQNLPNNFAFDNVASLGLSLPTDLCFLPGDRVLISDKGGDISLYANGAITTLGSIANVSTTSESGLVTIEADPQFSVNGYIYIYYTHSSGFNYCERLTCTGDLAVAGSSNLAFSAASRRVILSSIPSVTPNHIGGSLRFGPDGMLYLSIGDDQSQCDAQNVTSKLGCLLRMNVQGLPPGSSAVEPPYDDLDPGDNPLSSATDFSQLVIAHGLRNPFRMEIDPATGDIYIGDVGGDLNDEVSRYDYVAGALPMVNFGWPWREGAQTGPTTCGPTQPPGLQDPIVSVPLGNADALIGGCLYRNNGGQYAFGPAYEGNVFYTDYFTGEFRRVVEGTPGVWAPAANAPGQPNANDWATLLQRCTAVRQGPDGAIWIVNGVWWNSQNARLARIRPSNGPANVISAVAGSSQVATAATYFPNALVVEVRDAAGNPVPNVDVGFQVLGPAELSASNPLVTDASGRASVFVRALDLAGPITVLASTPGSAAVASFDLHSRRLTATTAPNSLTLDIDNVTQATSGSVQYIVMMSFPGSPVLPTFFGSLCVDPTYALAIVLEDGTGLFGNVSFSGTGGVGSPSLSNLYPVPPGLLSGQLMSFQAVGFDPITGWFRTNCEQVQF